VCISLGLFSFVVTDKKEFRQAWQVIFVKVDMRNNKTIIAQKLMM
jgi:hypothetical protein